MSNLSQQEKNDIIATRIMHSGTFYSMNWTLDTGPQGRLWSYLGNPFNPCKSLDDCFLAEEKMTIPLCALYVVALCEITKSKEGSWNVLHATPEQKVSAMLKALDVS